LFLKWQGAELKSCFTILILYTDGVYDSSNEKDRLQIERVIRDHQDQWAKEICNAILEHAVKQDENLRQINEEDRIYDKTVFIIKSG
jgi:serine phosphatase RsbU (regulator of sigma subunit)